MNMEKLRKITDLFREKETVLRCSAVIVAAGSSERMGSDKLTAELGGMPVLARTLKVFDGCGAVDEIIVVTRADRIEEIAELCRQYGIRKIAKVLAGGATHPFVMAMSYGAAFISTSAIVGFGGVAAAYGLGLQWLVFMNIFTGIFIAFIFFGRSTRRIGRNLNAKTFPEFLALRFASPRLRVLISGIIFLLVETVGLWFLNGHYNIPPDRLGAANWVMQCAMLVLVINLVSVPFNAVIIAHEQMRAFAFISIVEAVLKLGVALLLSVSGFDKLQTYAVLMVAVALAVRGIYAAYCRRFPECRGRLVFDRETFRKMTGFAGRLNIE